MNIVNNRLRLGNKKTIGKILQPVNHYSRFPEYDLFFHNLLNVESLVDDVTPRILDIGSPKLFGLYLASKLSVELVMTDISKSNIDEYVLMWDAIREKAPGDASFELQDVRSLGYETDSFDAVYSMSVLEHVEGENIEAQALSEMVRVLKPGGILIFSVPIGMRFVEQLRPLQGYDHRGDAKIGTHFFQRIYSPEMIQKRLLAPVDNLLTNMKTITIIRKPTPLLRRYLSLGQTTRGLLGILNPIMSGLYNVEAKPGDDIPSYYGKRHAPSDIYGDFICYGTKITVPL